MYAIRHEQTLIIDAEQLVLSLIITAGTTDLQLNFRIPYPDMWPTLLSSRLNNLSTPWQITRLSRMIYAYYDLCWFFVYVTFLSFAQ